MGGEREKFHTHFKVASSGVVKLKIIFCQQFYSFISYFVSVREDPILHPTGRQHEIDVLPHWISKHSRYTDLRASFAELERWPPRFDCRPQADDRANGRFL